MEPRYKRITTAICNLEADNGVALIDLAGDTQDEKAHDAREIFAAVVAHYPQRTAHLVVHGDTLHSTCWIFIDWAESARLGRDRVLALYLPIDEAPATQLPVEAT
jgi:hypothetical protein